MGIGPRVWQTLGARYKKKLRSRQTSSGEKMRGRKSSCLGGGNEKKERRKKPRWVRKDKDGGKGHDSHTGMAYSRVGMRHQCRSFVQMDTERVNRQETRYSTELSQEEGKSPVHQ